MRMMRNRTKKNATPRMNSITSLMPTPLSGRLETKGIARKRHPACYRLLKCFPAGLGDMRSKSSSSSLPISASRSSWASQQQKPFNGINSISLNGFSYLWFVYRFSKLTRPWRVSAPRSPPRLALPRCAPDAERRERYDESDDEVPHDDTLSCYTWEGGTPPKRYPFLA